MEADPAFAVRVRRLLSSVHLGPRRSGQGRPEEFGPIRGQVVSASLDLA
jgi:hypothetical protein